MSSINDVAEHAGVSNATVSRVLANKPHVSQAMRQRVMASVEALGYQPDETARRLREHSTSRVIGLIISDIQNPHFSAVVRGVEDYAYETGMNLILCNAASKPERQLFYLQLMQSERAAGLIISPTDRHKDGLPLEKLRQAGTSIVLLDSDVAGHTFDTVLVDDRQASCNAVQHLIAHGYEQIAIITGPSSVLTGQNRLKGYFDALKEAQMPVDKRLIQHSDFTQESSYACMVELLNSPIRPDAVFVSSNMMTLGALEALQDYKVKIPDEIALIGFDEVPWAKVTQPSLSTVAQPTYDIGREALRLLKRRLDEPEAPYLSVVLKTQMMLRNSCGCSLPV